MNTFEKVWNFIFVSSADPTKTSLTLKMALLGVIPFVMQATSIACGFHLVCLNVDGNVLSEIIQSVANLVFLVLSAVATIGGGYGLVRKLWTTADGTNKALQ